MVPVNLPFSQAARIVALLLITVAISGFGMIRDTLYFGVSTLIDLGAHTFA